MELAIGKSIDRISQLPDSILSHILSFLPTKYAVGTSILSTRWRYLWASVSNFDFDDSELFQDLSQLSSPRGDEIYLSFMNFVNRVLLLTDVSCFRKFHVSLNSDGNFDLVDTWICAAIKRNVQELRLHYCISWHASLPHMLFTSKTLVVLMLSAFISVEVPTSVWLPSLKILNLEGVLYENDDSAQKLFSGCPVLEELYIERTTLDDRRLLSVSVPTLKRLRIQCLTDDYAEVIGELDDSQTIDESNGPKCKLVVNCPSLEHFDLTDFVSEDFLLENLSYLSKAYVDVKRTCSVYTRLTSYGGRLYKILSGMENVKFLSLSESTLFFLSTVSDHVLPAFHNLICLELVSSGDPGWNLLTDFLECSPNLEVLTLKKEGLTPLNSAKCWRRPRRVPNCLLLHLKEIRIKEFSGKEYQLKAVEYLLKYTEVLNMMAIDCVDLNPEEEYSICEKLVWFPRGSSTSLLELRFEVGHNIPDELNYSSSEN